MAPVRVKICGLRSAADVQAATDAGAAYVGFVFFPRSPRNVAPEMARDAALATPVGVAKVALTVDADDAMLDAILRTVPLDMLQLHGHETPERVAQVRARHGLPVMKVIGVATEADLAEVDRYAKVADQLLIETKPAPGALPGGNGVPFDWTLLSGRRWPLPWMLAGGLNLTNIAEAIRISGARQVDLSSGVESAPGVKDYGKIAAFMAAVKGE
jgi:phosphoribosylanthranilate isomerase